MELKRIDGHGELTEFYKRNELEIENGWEYTDGVFFSEAALASNGDIACAYSLSERFGVTVLDYIAVEASERGKGVGAEMIERVRKKVRELGKSRVYLTARAKRFFEKQGAVPLDPVHPLYAELLGECAECDQRDRVCFPCVMAIECGCNNDSSARRNDR